MSTITPTPSRDLTPRVQLIPPRQTRQQILGQLNYIAYWLSNYTYKPLLEINQMSHVATSQPQNLTDALLRHVISIQMEKLLENTLVKLPPHEAEPIKITLTTPGILTLNRDGELLTVLRKNTQISRKALTDVKIQLEQRSLKKWQNSLLLDITDPAGNGFIPYILVMIKTKKHAQEIQALKQRALDQLDRLKNALAPPRNPG